VRILQATTAVGWSGGTEQALLLAKYLNDLGVKTDILCFKNTELERRALNLGIGVRYFPNTKKLSLREAAELSKITSQYDLINTHISKAHWFVWLSTFFSKKRPKLVYTRRVPFPLSKISLLTKYNINTDAVVAVSPEIYKTLKKIPFIRKKLHYIPSGVELDRFNPEKIGKIKKSDIGIPEDSIVLTNVGNFSQVKGHQVLLPAFRKFRSKFKNSYLILVGRDTKSNECLSLIEKLGLRESVVPLGFRRDVPEILKITDIFVFPSLNEGIAGSLLQAMAMERIVVASFVGGIRSYLRDMENGIAVEAGSVESLYRGLLKAVENLENDEMRKNARKTAEEFDIKKVTERTLKLYEELLNG